MMGLEQVEVRRSKRAKNILIHVSAEKGVELVMPWRVSLRQAEMFLRAQEGWILKQLELLDVKERQVVRRNFETGEKVNFLDEIYELKIETRNVKRASTKLDEHFLVVKVDDESKTKKAIEQWYRRQAREIFGEWAEEMAEDINVSVNSIRIGNQKSQWGSCTRPGRLSFNWRLLLAPERIAKYVVAHEVAHIRQANHSKKFWNLVGEIYPGYEIYKDWLKENGYKLVL